jgi:splicing factor 3A subunit 1
METAPEEVVIVPPPEIRAVVDKTAEYVAQVGPSFEAKVYAKEKNNPKFQFLMPQSHYHAYYRQQVERSKQGGDQEKKREPDEQQAAMQQEAKEAEAAAAAAAAAETQTTLEPPAVLSFVAELPESISAVALEVLSLAAQHVAVNGPPFHQALLNRERNSPLFAFLEASHAHHELYTQLVAQYEKVIELRSAAAEETRKTLLAEDRATVLQRVLRRVEWERAEREKKAREVAAAKKGIARADDDAIASQVDWDDFVVVQLIDLDDDPRYVLLFFLSSLFAS